MEVELTRHSIERCKERLSLNEASLLKLAERALEKGKTHSEAKGKLNKYLNKIWLEYKTANNVRIYGDVLYLFSNNKLITLYQLPRELLKYVKL